MSPVTMVCLANSRKYGGRCIAGLAWKENDHWVWIRPVSNHGSGELNAERFYEDGTEPQLLDLIDISLLQPNPIGCHSEDVLVDSAKPWHKLDNLTYEEALDLVSMPCSSLWVNGKRTSHGINDVMDERVASRMKSSLKLICPDKLTMTATSEHDHKRKVRGEFRLRNSSYKLTVTDPLIEQEFSQYELGTKRTTLKPLLCISIGQAFERTHACYKLIAGVMEA